MYFLSGEVYSYDHFGISLLWLGKKGEIWYRNTWDPFTIEPQNELKITLCCYPPILLSSGAEVTIAWIKAITVLVVVVSALASLTAALAAFLACSTFCSLLQHLLCLQLFDDTGKGIGDDYDKDPNEESSQQTENMILKHLRSQNNSATKQIKNANPSYLHIFCGGSDCSLNQSHHSCGCSCSFSFFGSCFSSSFSSPLGLPCLLQHLLCLQLFDDTGEGIGDDKDHDEESSQQDEHRGHDVPDVFAGDAPIPRQLGGCLQLRSCLGSTRASAEDRDPVGGQGHCVACCPVFIVGGQGLEGAASVATHSRHGAVRRSCRLVLVGFSKETKSCPTLHTFFFNFKPPTPC